MLACLALLDSWRYDFESGLPETVLNLILPLVWGVLIALAVQLDPLTSDTAFWLTRPYRRPALLAAKILFRRRHHTFAGADRACIHSQFRMAFDVSVRSCGGRSC